MAGNGESFLFILDYRLKTAILLPIEECLKYGILFDIEGVSNAPESADHIDIQLKKNPIPFAEYLKSFQQIQTAIQKGNSYLANLTCSTPIEANASLSEIFGQSAAPYKLLFMNQFLVFSPECFVKISQGKISTFPMKGTIDASLDGAEELLMRNEKETAEHATIVDLLRNDLSRVASNVQVEKYRYIERINTSGKSLLQMSSVISGDLPPSHRDTLGDLILELLPAGSICGAPKQSTLNIIEKAESHERGFYTGVFGIFDGESLNSGVMIRFIENQGGQLFYKSGGGITAKSDPWEEYQELIDKIYVPLN